MQEKSASITWALVKIAKTQTDDRQEIGPG